MYSGSGAYLRARTDILLRNKPDRYYSSSLLSVSRNKAPGKKEQQERVSGVSPNAIVISACQLHGLNYSGIRLGTVQTLCRSVPSINKLILLSLSFLTSKAGTTAHTSPRPCEDTAHKSCSPGLAQRAPCFSCGFLWCHSFYSQLCYPPPVKPSGRCSLPSSSKHQVPSSLFSLLSVFLYLMFT